MTNINLISMEQIRWVSVSVMSSLLSIIVPTRGLIVALVIMCGWNVWCGMRADGVIIHTCKNFSKKKFKGALLELLLYVAIIYLIRSVTYLCGDNSEGMYAIKALTYIFMYVYLQHSFRNLAIAYPRNAAIWIIYLFIRLEFNKMAPGYLKPLLDQYDKHIKEQEAQEQQTQNTPNT